MLNTSGERMKYSVLTLLLALFALFNCSVAGEQSKIAWELDQTKAFERSATAHKPLVVDMWAVWCAPCKVMEETTFVDDRVVSALNGIVPLKLDIDANPIFTQRYDLVNYPTTLFLDQDAREITRLEGLVDAEQLLNTLKDVLAGYGDYLDRVEQRSDPLALQSVAKYLIQVGNPSGAGESLRRALKTVKGDDRLREELELLQAETWLTLGRSGAATKAFNRLATQATTREIQGRALIDLILAERDQRTSKPDAQALDRLRREFPELADQIQAGTVQ